jgi:hypothetical protein
MYAVAGLLTAFALHSTSSHHPLYTRERDCTRDARNIHAERRATPTALYTLVRADVEITARLASSPRLCCVSLFYPESARGRSGRAARRFALSTVA